MVEKTTQDITNPDILVISRVLLINGDSKFLMIRRSKDDLYLPDNWELPGGKLEIGQDIITSTDREISEETGLKLTDMKPMVYIDSYIIPEGRYEGRLYLGIYSFAKPISTKVELSFEHSDYIWTNYEESLKLEMGESMEKALHELKEHL